jgi:hypothetical protein
MCWPTPPARVPSVVKRPPPKGLTGRVQHHDPTVGSRQQTRYQPEAGAANNARFDPGHHRPVDTCPGRQLALREVSALPSRSEQDIKPQAS